MATKETTGAGGVSDSRPRIEYVLPDGKKVTVIADHGERPTATIGYQLADGAIVTARLADEYYGVVCVTARGAEQVVSHLTLSDMESAERAAIKRNAHPNATALQFVHHAARVTLNQAYTSPSNKFVEVTARAATPTDGGAR